MKRRRYVNCLFLFVNTSSWYRFSVAEDPLAVLAYETQSSQQHEDDIDDLSERCEDLSEREEVRAVSCLNNAILSLDSETDSFTIVQRFLKPIGSYPLQDITIYKVDVPQWKISMLSIFYHPDNITESLMDILEISPLNLLHHSCTKSWRHV